MVASATAVHHIVLIFIATVLVVASFAAMPIASASTMVSAGCTGATPLERQDRVPGRMCPGKRFWSCPKRLLPLQMISTNRLMLCRTSLQGSGSSTRMRPLPPTSQRITTDMEWILAGPSVGWLVDDPDRYLSDEELAAPPPLMYYYPGYEYGSGLPSLTPSDEDPEHFNLPGYDPLPEFSSPHVAVPLDALKPRLVINLLPKVKTEEINAVAPTPALPARRDLNLPTLEVGEEEHQEALPPSALPTPSLEACVLLCRFASAMAARPAGIRANTWLPEALGLTGHVAD
uniref:Uncharacterized protein n=1 Tax=Triticum urartu TaxID=4572 RepID=A0A8R7PID6_TRIUA